MEVPLRVILARHSQARATGLEQAQKFEVLRYPLLGPKEPKFGPESQNAKSRSPTRARATTFVLEYLPSLLINSQHVTCSWLAGLHGGSEYTRKVWAVPY